MITVVILDSRSEYKRYNLASEEVERNIRITLFSKW